ncbi:hypothetical protein HC928_11745 [bacterium]|nr:hypothetical protein [bacterium]
MKSHLQQQTSATISLIRSSLREDMIGSIEGYDWQSDPHLNLYCKIAADQNRAMYHLRDALLVRLRFEGNQVRVERQESDPAMKLLLATARQEMREWDAEQLVAAEDLTYSQVLALEQKEGLSPEERLAIAKYYFKDFYCFDRPTIEEVLWDQEGRRRGELLNLEAQLFAETAIDRTTKALEKQVNWNQGLCPWDIPQTELRRRIRQEIGLDELIEQMRQGWEWCKYDLVPYAERARQLTPQIKVALNFTIIPKMSDVQIIHQLMSQLGIKMARSRWSRSVPGHEGEKLRVYQLDWAHWQQVWAILERRQFRRSQFQASAQEATTPSDSSGSAPAITRKSPGHDPVSAAAGWFTPDNLAEVKALWEMAKDNPMMLAELRQMVPIGVLQHLGLVA